MNKTISDINKSLWELEKEYDLLNIKVKGAKIWQIVRFRVFRELTEVFKLHGQAHTSKNTFKDKFKYLSRLFYNSIARSPMRGQYEKDVLIFDHPRKQKFNNGFKDIYTHDFIQCLSENEYAIIESPYLWTHYRNIDEKNRYYSDNMILNSFIKKKISPLKLTTEEKNRVEYIERVINQKFNTNIKLLKTIENTLSGFKYRYDYYLKLFKKRKPSQIYLVVSYGHAPLIAAAKDLGIEVIEFQHGVITDYHFGYNFGVPSQYIKYFPDKLLTFGDYWAHTKGFPEQTEIEVYGFPGKAQGRFSCFLLICQGTYYALQHKTKFNRKR